MLDPTTARTIATQLLREARSFLILQAVLLALSAAVVLAAGYLAIQSAISFWLPTGDAFPELARGLAPLRSGPIMSLTSNPSTPTVTPCYTIQTAAGIKRAVMSDRCKGQL